MCGLVGIAATHRIDKAAWLANGLDAMAHRGPDAVGEWWSGDGRVGLGHRRLAIIDLSPSGHQPMHYASGRLSIVYNGEIYNYRELREELSSLGFTFRSSGDTEVLLAAYAAWGRACLSRLNGMFVFALYDADRQTLFLARDRAGEKPLYYHVSDGTLRFASELKALLVDPSMPRRILPEALDCYLAMGFVPGQLCILDGYNKLPPAHALSFDLQTGAVETWRYWSLPNLSSAAESGDESELLAELEELLEDAVARQMVADVPFGVLLSGGLDSSLVTAMAVRRSGKVRTFSIGFPGHGAMDETPHARLIARHFGTDHTELMAEPTTADILPCLARQFDEPMVDSSMIPTWLVSRLVRQHCTVALSGDGGDELFGGYTHYSRLLWLQQRQRMLPLGMLRVVARSAERLPEGFAGGNIRTWLMAAGCDLRNDLPPIANHFDPKARQRLLRNVDSYQPAAERIRDEYMPVQSDLLQRATRMDFNDYLPEDLLVKVDRASMLNSLEMRAPLLDYRLIEFSFGRVPSHLKATPHDKKIMLKRLGTRLLPPEFDTRRKQGFSIPLTAWLKEGPFRELFWDTLTASDCMFDKNATSALLEGQDRGHSNGERLFALVQFELWRRHYGAAL